MAKDSFTSFPVPSAQVPVQVWALQPSKWQLTSASCIQQTNKPQFWLSHIEATTLSCCVILIGLGLNCQGPTPDSRAVSAVPLWWSPWFRVREGKFAPTGEKHTGLQSQAEIQISQVFCCEDMLKIVKSILTQNLTRLSALALNQEFHLFSANLGSRQITSSHIKPYETLYGLLIGKLIWLNMT